MDPQGNASSGIGVRRYEHPDSNIYHVLIGEKTLEETAIATSIENLFISPANPDLVGAEIELVDMSRREYRLQEAIKSVSDHFDYILIDCPPSLGLLTVNALTASNTFLVPLQCELLCLGRVEPVIEYSGVNQKEP